MRFSAKRFLLLVIVASLAVALLVTRKGRHASTQDDPDALRAKIDEIRQRLREELERQLPPSAFPAGPEPGRRTP